MSRAPEVRLRSDKPLPICRKQVSPLPRGVFRVSEFRQGETATERRWRTLDDQPTVLDQPAPAELVFGPDKRQEGGVLPAPAVGDYDAKGSRKDVLRAFGELDEDKPERMTVSMEQVLDAEKRRAMQLSLRHKVHEEAFLEVEDPAPELRWHQKLGLPRFDRDALFFAVTVFASAVAAAAAALALLD